ncbi:MAG: arginase family protein [Thermoproteota archaeon]|nr:arginase family protein [Thermoproteota archaeon]
MSKLDILQLFIVPERTKAGYSFADLPIKISFKQSRAIVYGVPLDITTSFGKGTWRGPEVIRQVSARQIETFILDENADIQDLIGIFDLGDLKLPKTRSIPKMLDHLDSTIPKIVALIRKDNKIPLMLGGEHTLSYYQLKSLAEEEPIVIHFDAHRDMKSKYESLKICHTTIFYHLLEYIPGENMIQIGIRQTDREENKTADKKGVTTFDAWQVHHEIDTIVKYLQKATSGKKIYISFDIDVYDLPYVPCTGTPEPFGLNPFQVLKLIKAIDRSAHLIGMDMVEVGLKNGDYREGTLATQTLYRILSRRYARP